jgi:hypothetical protein
MKRLIFFRKTSVFSAIFCTLFLLTVLSTSASAGQIYATSYDLYNGGIGGYGYSYFYDDKYTGTGSKTTPYAYLSGGLGDLTDGIAATLNWWDGVWPPGQSLDQNIPYVAWNNGSAGYGTLPNPILPFVTFHFASTENIDEVKINMNYGYHANPVDFLMGGVTVTRTVDNVNPGTPNKWYDFTGLGLSGDTLTLTFHYNPEWVFVSEVQFYGTNAVPEPCTMLLLGSGLIGLAGYGRKKFFRN